MNAFVLVVLLSVLQPTAMQTFAPDAEGFIRNWLADSGEGTVKWWDRARGYGAVSVGKIAPWDVWCHFSSIDAGATVSSRQASLFRSTTAVPIRTASSTSRRK